MLHSILITGGTTNQRLEKLQQLLSIDLKPDPDLLTLKPDPSITIKQVRTIDKFLSRKPIKQDYNLVVLISADKLTLQAQNAILKTLEEPPVNSKIVLMSPSQHQLIPTIVSRCQLINLKADRKISKASNQKQQKIFDQIVKSSIAQRISLVSDYAKSKEIALDLLTHQLHFVKDSILVYPDLTRSMLNSINFLKANVNPKLVLEVLFFSYPKKS
jgi:DNA polymerase III delta prime subunit